MAKLIPYALAALCFAACVGCLALWGWTASHPRTVDCAMFDLGRLAIDTQVCNGEAKVAWYRRTSTRPRVAWPFRTASLGGVYLTQFELTIKSQGAFATGARSIYFPLWYPALVSALAGVAALRYRRQFTIRSALVAMSVVAALLGMIVAL